MRAFYTDPLAAAWMAKHFGMKFLDSPRQKYKTCQFRQASAHDHYDGTVWAEIIDHEDVKVYIHPDRLHLLEVRDGDLRVRDGDLFRAELQYGMADGHPHLVEVFLDEDGDYGSIPRIIQRNGIPFHWPEFE